MLMCLFHITLVSNGLFTVTAWLAWNYAYRLCDSFLQKTMDKSTVMQSVRA